MAKNSTGRRRKDRQAHHWLRRLIVGVVVVIVVLAIAPLAVVGIASAGRQSGVDTVAAHDVAIVFGAGLSDGEPGPFLQARLQVARDLYFAGKAKVILVSGDNLTPYHNEPAAMTTWLVGQGVPAAKIVQDYAGEDTYSTCMRAKQIFGVDSAILVSQSYHLSRAIATCRLIGLDAVGVGDNTMLSQYPALWREYQLRELAADINLIRELVTHRQPILGAAEPGVRQALGA